MRILEALEKNVSVGEIPIRKVLAIAHDLP